MIKFFFSIILITFYSVINFANAENKKEDYFLKGKDFFDQKKYVKAKFKFEQDIVYNPKNSTSYFYLSKIFKIEKKNKLEETNLKTVLLLNPSNEEALYNLTILNINKSNFSEAKKLIEKFDKICLKICDNTNELNRQLKNSLKK